jgi:hypothetical protein
MMNEVIPGAVSFGTTVALLFKQERTLTSNTGGRHEIHNR